MKRVVLGGISVAVLAALILGDIPSGLFLQCVRDSSAAEGPKPAKLSVLKKKGEDRPRVIAGAILLPGSYIVAFTPPAGANELQAEVFVTYIPKGKRKVGSTEKEFPAQVVFSGHQIIAGDNNQPLAAISVMKVGTNNYLVEFKEPGGVIIKAPIVTLD